MSKGRLLLPTRFRYEATVMNTEPPRPESIPPTPPKLDGAISAFDAAEGVGQVVLDDGRTADFGRSACLGFAPFVRQRVQVGRVLRDASGVWAAESLSLLSHPEKAILPSDAPERSPFAPDPRAPHYGWVTVLLSEFPKTPAAWKACFATAGLERLRVVVHENLQAQGPERQGAVRLELLMPGIHMLALATPGTLARESLDVRSLPPDFELGLGKLGLAPLLLDPVRLREASEDAFADPWGMDGYMRVASQVVQGLLKAGPGVGVVLPLAGNLVLSREDFLRRLSDLQRPECKPFGAWVDWVLTEERRTYRSVGMEAFGALDVEVEILNTHADVELDSAESAVLFACMLQARENRILRDGEVLYVQRDIRVGPYGASANDERGYRYHVERAGRRLKLVRK